MLQAVHTSERPRGRMQIERTKRRFGRVTRQKAVADCIDRRSPRPLADAVSHSSLQVAKLVVRLGNTFSTVAWQRAAICHHFSIPPSSVDWRRAVTQCSLVRWYCAPLGSAKPHESDGDRRWRWLWRVRGCLVRGARDDERRRWTGTGGEGLLRDDDGDETRESRCEGERRKEKF